MLPILASIIAYLNDTITEENGSFCWEGCILIFEANVKNKLNIRVLKSLVIDAKSSVYQAII